MSKISHLKVIDESRYQMLLAVARRLASMELWDAGIDFERKFLQVEIRIVKYPA